MKKVEQTFPAHWASYLINGDASGIAYAERVTIDALLKSKGLPSPLSCSDEARFSRTNDAGTLPGDVLEYTFLLPETHADKLAKHLAETPDAPWAGADFVSSFGVRIRCFQLLNADGVAVAIATFEDRVCMEVQSSNTVPSYEHEAFRLACEQLVTV